MIFQTKPHVETLEQLGRKNEVCDLQTSQNCIHLKTPFWKTKRPKMQVQRTYWMAGGLLEQFPPEAVLSCPRDAKDNQQMMQRIALIAVCSKLVQDQVQFFSKHSVGYTVHQDHFNMQQLQHSSTCNSHPQKSSIFFKPQPARSSSSMAFLSSSSLIVPCMGVSPLPWGMEYWTSDAVTPIWPVEGTKNPFSEVHYSTRKNVPIQFQAVKMWQNSRIHHTIQLFSSSSICFLYLKGPFQVKQTELRLPLKALIPELEKSESKPLKLANPLLHFS